MKKLIAFALINFLLIAPLADGRELSKTDFTRGINVLFLKENYAEVIKNREEHLNFYRLGIKEKKEVLYLTGLSYVKLGNFAKAREVFNEILAIRGDQLRQDAYIGIANSYFYGKKFDEAIKTYEYVVNTYPGSDRLSSVYYNLGLASKAKNDSDRANYYFQKVKKQYNTSFEANKIAYLPGGKAEEPDYYIVQLGAFKSLKNAKKLQGKLTRKRYDSYIEKAKEGGDVLYKVKGGRFSNVYYAQRLVRKLRKNGFSAKIIVE